MELNTHEKTGFLFLVITALIYLGCVLTNLPEPYLTFVMFLAALIGFIGAVLILDWIAALVIRRFEAARLAMAEPYTTIVNKISTLDPHQVRLLENLDWLNDKNEEAE